ncbi:hypothetical protein [Odoribacter sp. Z80]|uniref:hypothetical protein n=1 Tax=Odoribacter sp. Z80 TaxID=2304575 RepID=UPI001379B839|nr:hypothetical protein [Odoribacter sp. Z80]NCE71650.1 hypothetical protein [Odoribacter sp. Z80]
MKEENNTIKSKRLKFIRTLMYLDALLILLSFMMLDVRNFSFTLHSGICVRIGVLVVIFGVLLAIEKNLSRYLRKHRNK